ncbi:MAG TPA: acetolactate synthase small subunit [bacterium]|nr:acetolactate synthase small subunit [bacterium]
MRHTISVLVENKFGVLARVAGLFSGRGYNIESLCVAPTTDPTVSQMTIVTTGDDRVIEQVTKQLNKLIDVIKVQDMMERDFIDREMMLVRVSAEREKRDEILRIAEIFKARVVDVAQKSLTLEVTGADDKIDAVLKILRPLGIRELVRTGKVAMIRAEPRK